MGGASSRSSVMLHSLFSTVLPKVLLWSQWPVFVLFLVIQFSRFMLANIRPSLHLHCSDSICIVPRISDNILLHVILQGGCFHFPEYFTLPSSVPWLTTKQVQEEAKRSSNQTSNLSKNGRTITNRGHQKNVKHPIGGVVAVIRSDVADEGSEHGNVGEGGSVVAAKRPDVSQREPAMAETLLTIPRTT